jgi:hypothetical protein
MPNDAHENISNLCDSKISGQISWFDGSALVGKGRSHFGRLGSREYPGRLYQAVEWPRRDAIQRFPDSDVAKKWGGCCPLVLREEHREMRRCSSELAIAAILVIPLAAWAQAPPSPVSQSPSITAHPQMSAHHRRHHVRPDDATSGLLNRMELERIEGPTPQALQGPSPNSSKGSGFGR